MAIDCSRAALLSTLRERATAIRKRDIVMLQRAGIGHPGGDFSAIDILTALYFGGILRINPAHPDDPNRDRFILSKGHAAGAFYVTLAEAGFFPVEELNSFAQPLSRLSGHPHCRELPGVEASTGPLGHGLAVAVGCALAAKMDGATWRTFVMTGDGELQEGSNWEAAMAASHFKLDNLTLIVDRNGLQLGDSTERTMALEPLGDKFRAFGWSVCDVDGHDFGALLDALGSVPHKPGRPTCIIAHTHKGKGVSFMEDKPEWHHRMPTEEELERALKELAGVTS